MTWSASAQVQNAITNSPWSTTIAITRGVASLGTFTGLFQHTQPDDPPIVHAARYSTGAAQVQQGDILTPTGFNAYTCEGVRSDGNYILTFHLRPHVVT